MRAGTGVTHSEYNHSTVDPVHFLQIWIVPDTRGLKSACAQRAFDRDASRRAFVLLASKDGPGASVAIHQDVRLWVASVGARERRELEVHPARHAWIHVARGSIAMNGTALGKGTARRSVGSSA